MFPREDTLIADHRSMPVEFRLDILFSLAYLADLGDGMNSQLSWKLVALPQFVVDFLLKSQLVLRFDSECVQNSEVARFVEAFHGLQERFFCSSLGRSFTSWLRSTVN
jgi:hypothetical protein